MKKRVYAVLAACVILFSGVAVRLYTLSDSVLQAASANQSTRTQTIAVSRGTIYDRYGVPLVNAQKEIVASIAPYDECIRALRQRLSGAEASSVMARFEEYERPVVTLSRWLPPTVGVVQAEVPVRYEECGLAPHVIGYIDASGQAVTGIEKGYDEVLLSYRGEATVRYAVDALGRPIETVDDEFSNTLDRSAGGIALTLDAQLQKVVQSAAENYLSRGAVIISNAVSSQILASASVPAYNQNDVAAVLSDPASPLIDRTCINYNCGSVFKIVTAAAALEAGIAPAKTYMCHGETVVDGIAFGCHSHGDKTALNMTEAMALSCNSYFIQLALEIGADTVLSTAIRFGLSDAVTVAADYVTAVPILPSMEDLSAPAALANFAIGQGDLLATPYHVNALMQTVVNDGVRRDMTLYYGKVDEHGKCTVSGHQPQETRVVSSRTAALLINMLQAVVDGGTGTSAALSTQAVAGKTGTAETGWMQNGSEVVQSWFVGCFPADNPQYIITVLSENGGRNGQTAAPLFAEIAKEIVASGLMLSE